MLVTMAVALYTSRVVLQVLGASDYGLYNVVGGVLSMFGMFSAALTVGTQRFLTYAMGENDFSKLKKTFSIAFGLHVIVALFIFILAETIGLWFFYTYLKIPDGRFNAAFWVYQFSIIGFMVNLIQVPFQSCLISHEEMDMYAYMSIYDVVMKLIVVFVIQYISLDKLILYATLIFVVNTTSVLIYNLYCRRKFSECTFYIIIDKQLTKEIIVYSGWNLFGGSLNFFTNQGVNILLNIFCGTVVNAARGLSITVNQYILNFAMNFQLAANPQIIKLYASREYDKLYRLVVNNSRLSSYMFLLVAIPAFIEIDYVLKLWLGVYPKYTDIFIQIILIQSLWMPLDYSVGLLIHASGRMKWPSIAAVGLMLIFPISFFLLKMGFSPVSIYVASAIIWSYHNIVDLYYANKYTGIPILKVLKGVYGNIMFGIVPMFSIPYAISKTLEEGLARFVIVGFSSVVTSLIVIYLIGLTPSMRKMVLRKLKIVK